MINNTNLETSEHGEFGMTENLACGIFILFIICAIAFLAFEMLMEWLGIEDIAESMDDEHWGEW